MAVEVPCHGPLAQQFHTMHPFAGKSIHWIDFWPGSNLDAAPAAVSAPSPPERAAEMFRGARGFVSGHGSGGECLPRRRILARRDHGICAAPGNGIVASACVAGTVGGDAADLLVRRDLAEQVGSHRGITDVAPGDPDSADLQFFPTNPEIDLAPDPPFGTASLRARHSPSPPTLMPVPSVSRCNGPLEPRQEMLTAKDFRRRDSALKSGAVQPRPTSRNRLSTKPVLWRRAMPNGTFIERPV
jgi:hypothetical protein